MYLSNGQASKPILRSFDTGSTKSLNFSHKAGCGPPDIIFGRTEYKEVSTESYVKIILRLYFGDNILLYGVPPGA
jgi:hypothetical protein